MYVLSFEARTLLRGLTLKEVELQHFVFYLAGWVLDKFACVEMKVSCVVRDIQDNYDPVALKRCTTMLIESEAQVPSLA
jgi:hypothetical protein